MQHWRHRKDRRDPLTVGRGIVAQVDGHNHPNAGETVVLAPVHDHVHVFDTESGERLSAS